MASRDPRPDEDEVIAQRVDDFFGRVAEARPDRGRNRSQTKPAFTGATPAAPPPPPPPGARPGAGDPAMVPAEDLGRIARFVETQLAKVRMDAASNADDVLAAIRESGARLTALEQRMARLGSSTSAAGSAGAAPDQSQVLEGLDAIAARLRALEQRTARLGSATTPGAVAAAPDQSQVLEGLSQIGKRLRALEERTARAPTPMATGGAYPDEVIEGLRQLEARLATIEQLTGRLVTWATERTARELAEHKWVMEVLAIIGDKAGVSRDELPPTYG